MMRYLIPAFLLLAGCMSIDLQKMQKDAVARLCNSDAAYEHGYNSGKAGEQMSSAFANNCASETQPRVVESYRKGFLEGSKLAQSQAPQQIVISHESSNRVLCTINVFGDKFEAWGESEKEARWKVGKLCAQKNDEIHCRDANCN